MNIPYIDISSQNSIIKKKLIHAANQVIEHGQFINGPEVSMLEDQLSKYLGTKHVIGVANGTAALYLSLR